MTMTDDRPMPQPRAPRKKKVKVPESLTANCVESIELQGRTLRVGDPIKVPSRPGRKDGYEGIVKRIRLTDRGMQIDVWGGKGNFASMRSFYPSQVEVYSTRKLNSIARKLAK